MAELTQKPIESNINESITVKFKINQYHTVAQVYASDTTIHTVLTDIAEKFQINAKYLQILHDTKPLPPAAKLFTLCHNEYHIIDVELCLNALAQQHNDHNSSENERIELDCDVYYRYGQQQETFIILIDWNLTNDKFCHLVAAIINCWTSCRFTYRPATMAKRPPNVSSSRSSTSQWSSHFSVVTCTRKRVRLIELMTHNRNKKYQFHSIYYCISFSVGFNTMCVPCIKKWSNRISRCLLADRPNDCWWESESPVDAYDPDDGATLLISGQCIYLPA